MYLETLIFIAIYFLIGDKIYRLVIIDMRRKIKNPHSEKDKELIFFMNDNIITWAIFIIFYPLIFLVGVILKAVEK